MKAWTRCCSSSLMPRYPFNWSLVYILADCVVTKHLNKVATALGSGYAVRDCNMMMNVQAAGQTPVGSQGFHTDLGPGQEGLVVIAPAQPTSLQLYVESNRILKELWRWEKMLKAGQVTKAGFNAWLGMRTFKAVRLQLNLGDILFMSGHTIHAGDVGIPNCPSLRLHWYVLKGQGAKDTMKHLVQYGEAFAKRFE